MTITNRAEARTARLSPFRFGAGLPSLNRLYSRDEVLGFEELLITALRGYTTAAARRCHRVDPFAYANWVQAVTRPEADDSPTSWACRLPTLLHLYADYVPSPECDFVEFGTGDTPCWIDAHGQMVLDVVTTLTMTELDPGESEHQAYMAARDAQQHLGHRFLGVRILVLDAPYESTWCPVEGDKQPLQTCDLSESATVDSAAKARSRGFAMKGDEVA